ncbi:MAG: hypothetical protein NXI13_04035 [Proteobacteria bacterium]|nr:hypothetical protein [Pseudomonadota bacterium]
MTISATTSDPYAYLDQNVPGEAITKYVPAPKMVDGKVVESKGVFGDDGFGFDDFLDIINPLQHIPFVSSLYREITGDEINPGSRMIGGTLFSGGIGLAVSFINSAIEDSTGKDVGEHVIAVFTGPETDLPEETLATVPVENPAEVTAPKLNLPESIEVNENAITNPAPQTVAPPEAREAITPIGLEWKGAQPDFQRNIEKAKAVHTEELTPAQLNAVFKSFRVDPPAASTTPAQAHAAYQKSALNSSPQTQEIAVSNAASSAEYPTGDDR